MVEFVSGLKICNYNLFKKLFKIMRSFMPFNVFKKGTKQIKNGRLFEARHLNTVELNHPLPPLAYASINTIYF